MNYMQMKGPENTLPMMGGQGQFGPTGMGVEFRKNSGDTLRQAPGKHDVTQR